MLILLYYKRMFIIDITYKDLKLKKLLNNQRKILYCRYNLIKKSLVTPAIYYNIGIGT